MKAVNGVSQDSLGCRQDALVTCNRDGKEDLGVNIDGVW